MAERLLVVSNRLPITIRPDAKGGARVEPSSGGLATGLAGPHERMGGLWIGWPGPLEGLSERARAGLEPQLAGRRLVPVTLSPEEVEAYYERYSNGVLWPLLHYAVARLPQDVTDFETYREVNERFAEAVAQHHRPGDLVWVHDYQLMLVPALLRERIPSARIGFFLHVPFPSSEIFRLLPQREELLAGLLGADLVGFHTAAFVRHFGSAVLRLLGPRGEVDRISWRGRAVKLGVFPMGIDAARFSTLALAPGVLEAADRHRASGAPGAQLLLGIDRLDYTKGIARRLAAFEALLRRHPPWRERVRLVQVAVPSRENVGAYREVRAEVEAMVGRLQGEFATASWSPVHYLYRSLARDDLVALYRAADVALVTPLRDGMNLVAKEFVASRPDGGGVLVLSEFAGAAAELSEALLVNPYDVEATAETLHRALSMPEDERAARMATLRDRVMGWDVHRWANGFLAALARGPGAAAGAAFSTTAELAAAMARARAAPRLALLLDYDGTLVPFATTPERAAPGPAVLALLVKLAARPDTEVHLVSGRRRATLERWFGALPIALHAEHGFWSRWPGEAWQGAGVEPGEWREPVLAILRDFAERTPGALIEEKTAGYAWHYRAAEPDFGADQAKELELHLQTMLSNVPVEVLPGDRVLEVRPHGIHKGLVAAAVRSRAGPGTLLLAMGDDRTDEDLFGALPDGSLAIHVGPAASRAPLRIRDVNAARALLAWLAEEAGAGRNAESPPAPH